LNLKILDRKCHYYSPLETSCHVQRSKGCGCKTTNQIRTKIWRQHDLTVIFYIS